MKVKSTVLLGLILFICLLCGVSLMAHLNSKQDEWRPSDIYSTLGGSRGNYFTTVSYGAGASSATSIPVLSHSGSLFNHGAAFSYAHAGVSVSQSPIANTAAPQGGLYLTSSAEVRTFGGGSNAVVSVNGGSAQMAPVSPIASVNGMNMSSSLSTASQLAAGAGLQMPTNMLSGLPSGDIAMAASYAGIGQTTAGGPMGISGRRDVPGIGGEWEGWLGTEWSGGSDGITFDMLKDLYARMTGDTDFSNQEQWDAFLAWFEGNQSNDKFGWYWAPISDAVPFVLLLCLVYAFVIYRKTKMAKNIKAEK
jgi:hypothetical protein